MTPQGMSGSAIITLIDGSVNNSMCTSLCISMRISLLTDLREYLNTFLFAPNQCNGGIWVLAPIQF